MSIERERAGVAHVFSLNFVQFLPTNCRMLALCKLLLSTYLLQLLP